MVRNYGESVGTQRGAGEGVLSGSYKCAIGRGAKAERYYYNIVTGVFHL